MKNFNKVTAYKANLSHLKSGVPWMHLGFIGGLFIHAGIINKNIPLIKSVSLFALGAVISGILGGVLIASLVALLGKHNASPVIIKVSQTVLSIAIYMIFAFFVFGQM